MEIMQGVTPFVISKDCNTTREQLLIKMAAAKVRVERTVQPPASGDPLVASNLFPTGCTPPGNWKADVEKELSTISSLQCNEAMARYLSLAYLLQYFGSSVFRNIESPTVCIFSRQY